MVNILKINSILVNIDIISSSYVNGFTQPTIYSFFPDVSLGYQIIENPHNLLYLPITSDTIHSISIWLTDQNGIELNFRGENLSTRFHQREIKKKYREFSDLHGEDVIALTKSQVDRLVEVYEEKNGMTIRMSKTQLAHNMKIEGGVLLALAGLIPFLTGTVLPAFGVGALSGMTNFRS